MDGIERQRRPLLRSSPGPSARQGHASTQWRRSARHRVRAPCVDPAVDAGLGPRPDAGRRAALRTAGHVGRAGPHGTHRARSERQSEPARLAAFNDFFNQRIRFAGDVETTGQVDEWASPLELLGRGAGDCEDYAIAKYFSLIAAGVPSARLRLVYVRADLDGGTIAHMVLAYYPQPTAEPLILDNLNPAVVAASMRRDLHPVFSFNAEGLWQGTGSQAAGDPVARLSRWRDVIAKARVQGFI
jgi:predicted transglutaminase-like cysteine proteinase